jgi:hypothetical protein
MFHALETTLPSSYWIFVGSGPEYLVDDEWPLPRWRELVLVLAALNSLEDQVSDVELARPHVALVVAS